MKNNQFSFSESIGSNRQIDLSKVTLSELGATGIGASQVLVQFEGTDPFPVEDHHYEMAFQIASAPSDSDLYIEIPPEMLEKRKVNKVNWQSLLK